MDIKKESHLGKYEPLEIIEKKQGYVVKTTKLILLNTIISEYSGDVFFKRCFIYKKRWFNNGINPQSGFIHFFSYINIQGSIRTFNIKEKN